MNIIDYADRDMLAINVAQVVAGQLESVLFSHERASFAVPGGTTPGPIFDALCAATLDWSRVHVMPTDERWVAEDDSRSNARLIRKRLLTSRAEAATLVPFYRAGQTPEAALDEIAESIAPYLPLSVLLLGMGEDMHTASIFAGAPGSAEALDAAAPPLAVVTPETQPETRVTLTAPVLDGALSKHLVIFGASKRAALERALTMPPEEAPVQAVLTDITVHWAE
ncbi:6-phosphogluconolactonase [Seohaeicola nanhaiensis]|uniref:6-phosphogluconolactonase n=1 Tax=Seohaeicola nanhaiensis TaxID=1387282 RepID=A0ABV9KNR3_9RHOB